MLQLTSADDRQAILDGAFDVPDNKYIATEGLPLTPFKSLDGKFAQTVGIIIFNGEDNVWKHLSVDDIKNIGKQIPANFTPQKKKRH